MQFVNGFTPAIFHFKMHLNRNAFGKELIMEDVFLI